MKVTRPAILLMSKAPVPGRSKTRLYSRLRGNYFPQPEGNLGQRIHFSVTEVWKQGFSPIIGIGSDIPTLRPSIFERALNLPAQSDICLGPTFDGGYYLIGLHKPVSELFHHIPWSTNEVLTATIQRINEQHLKASFLKYFNDIDVWEDLLSLYRQLDLSSVRPENTSKILAEILQQAGIT